MTHLDETGFVSCSIPEIGLLGQILNIEHGRKLPVSMNPIWAQHKFKRQSFCLAFNIWRKIQAFLGRPISSVPLGNSRLTLVKNLDYFLPLSENPTGLRWLILRYCLLSNYPRSSFVLVAKCPLPQLVHCWLSPGLSGPTLSVFAPQSNTDLWTFFMSEAATLSTSSPPILPPWTNAMLAGQIFFSNLFLYRDFALD